MRHQYANGIVFAGEQLTSDSVPFSDTHAVGRDAEGWYLHDSVRVHRLILGDWVVRDLDGDYYPVTQQLFDLVFSADGVRARKRRQARP